MAIAENHAVREGTALKHETSAVATSEAALARFQGIRVLVIDDNKFARSLLRNVLQVLGLWQVKECMAIKDGLACLAEDQIDLVLIENRMTGGSGIEFTKAVRRSETVRNPAVPIIMVSDQTDFFDIRQAIDSGIHDFLAKPYSAASLAKRLILCLTDERPMVREFDYVGPCRRTSGLRRPEAAVDRRKVRS